ncbi:hypothetical protein Bbelb_124410 [Branchiostoma belcheri]|nr:hypothetical protein Bbelb_124410 [Branchiostoma belcheri]
MSASYRTVVFLCVLMWVVQSSRDRPVGDTTCERCVCMKTLVSCYGLRLKTVPKKIPPAAKRIFMDHNDISAIKNQSFRDAHSTKVLNLSNNAIADIEAGAFDGLGDLVSLLLQSNRLSVVKNHFFLGLPMVKFIHLQNNYIRYVSESPFSTLRWLRQVNLRNNLLQTVPWDAMKTLNKESAWSLTTYFLEGNKIQHPKPPPQDLRSRKPVLGIRLAKNPLKCDCDFGEFFDWLIDNGQEKITVEDAKLLICHRPCELKNTPILTMPRTQLICEDGHATDSWTTPETDEHCDLDNATSEPTNPSATDFLGLTAGLDKPPKPSTDSHEAVTTPKVVIYLMKDRTNNFVPNTDFRMTDDPSNDTMRQSVHFYEDIDIARNEAKQVQNERDPDQDSAFGDLND